MGLSAPIYIRLLNARFKLSEETFDKTAEANVIYKQMKLKKVNLRSYLDSAEEETLTKIWGLKSSVWSSRRRRL